MNYVNKSITQSKKDDDANLNPILRTPSTLERGGDKSPRAQSPEANSPIGGNPIKKLFQFGSALKKYPEKAD